MSAKPENERERIARIIDPEAYRDFPVGGEEPEHDWFDRKQALAKADAIIAQRETGAPETDTIDSFADLHAKPVDAEALAEPVAWRWRLHPQTPWHLVPDDPRDDELYVEPLYAAPPPAEAHARIEALEKCVSWAVDAVDHLAATMVSDDYHARLVKRVAWMRSLLSGSTPKPARVEITEEMVERAARAVDPEIWEHDTPTIPTRAKVEDFHHRRQKSVRIARAALTAALTGASAKEGEV